MVRLIDVVGHEQSLGILRRSLSENRLPHSLIFHGPHGVGKRTVATALAAALNCLEESGDACGRCASCQKVDKGVHPDVRYFTVEKTVIPIDSIRELREEAFYSPYEGRRRVFLVDPADRLSAQAQNALLKTLEEPSPTSLIVLITTRLLQLLPTTRSRCQMLSFGTLPTDRLAERLAGVQRLSPEDAGRIARLSGGRFGAALTMDLALNDQVREGLLQLLSRLAEDRTRDHVLTDVELFGTETEEIASRLDQLAGLVRDMMILRSGAGQETLINNDRVDDLAEIAGRFSSGLDIVLDRIGLALSDLEHYVNRRVLLETLLFDIAERRAPA